MKNKTKARSAAVPKVDPYIEGLMAKLLERLVSLEKKMDTVLSQTASRPASNGSQGKPAPHVPAQQPPRHDRIMYEAICADCSKVCEVPFKPSEDRAVYCKECFARRKSGSNGHRPGMPVLTPVAMPPRPAAKPQTASKPAPQAGAKPAKAKKASPAKKAKKKK